MFDNTELKTLGVLSAIAQHPLTGRRRRMEFFVTPAHNRAILGIDACVEMDLLYVNHDNICEIQDARSSPTSSTTNSPPSTRKRGRGRGGRIVTAKRSAPPQPPPPPESLSTPPSPQTHGGSPTEALLSRPLTKEYIVERYAELFQGVGLLQGEVHLETDPSVTPVQLPPRRLPVPIRDEVKRELDAMCRDGIIEPVTGPSTWISALLVVRKPNGKVRICIDPKPLNKSLRRCNYMMGTIDDVLPRLAKAKVFSTLDVRNGFWNLRLDEESKALTTFETPFGRYRWCRLAFGLSPSPEIFQARMHATLEGLAGVACIADDILVYGCGETVEEAEKDHDRNLISLLERCRERNLHLNDDKIQLRRQSITFMGHELTTDGLKADKRKVAAIVDMPRPTDRPGVRRLIGMATYLGRFLPNLSDVLAPLRELLSQDVEFRWDDAKHGEALRRLKAMLTSAPVLNYYDVNKPVLIQADASSTGVGGVILQPFYRTANQLSLPRAH